jgi:glycosyltransferase involved in cell wall biosynthesis
MVASSIAGLRGKKIVHNFHDGQVDEFLREYFGIAKLFLGSELIVVATDYLKKSFDKFGFNTIKISNHYNVIDHKPAKQKNCKKLKVIWARSFEKLYDPETAIMAAIHFSDNPDIEFDFYGTGKYLEYYKEKYKNEKVNFLGYISREELLKKYSDYDIFLNTSLYDNFPMSIIEAGMNRLIVISSKAGGIPTIYGENEIIFYEPGNREDLIAKLYNVLNNREIYSSHAERLQNRVISFTWDYVKEDWMRLITEKIKEPER